MGCLLEIAYPLTPQRIWLHPVRRNEQAYLDSAALAMLRLRGLIAGTDLPGTSSRPHGWGES